MRINRKSHKLIKIIKEYRKASIIANADRVSRQNSISDAEGQQTESQETSYEGNRTQRILVLNRKTETI